MRPIIYAVIAVFFYGSASAIIEQKLVHLKTLNLLIGEFVITLGLAIIVRQWIIMRNPANDLAFPTDKATWIAFIVLGVVVFIANYFFCGSLTLGGNAVVITSLMILMPVATIAVRSIWIREVPNLYQIGGYILAALSVLLVAKGSIK
jgi:drug/metabolite transporter (DMT)-like permease